MAQAIETAKNPVSNQASPPPKRLSALTAKQAEIRI